MGQDCIFCKIAKKEIPADIVYEDEDVVAFNDIRPQAPVHVVVIPRTHIEKLSDLKEGDEVLAARIISAGNKIAKKRDIVLSGYRFVINCNRDAGQEVFHLHMHLLGGRKMGWPPG